MIGEHVNLASQSIIKRDAKNEHAGCRCDGSYVRAGFFFVSRLLASRMHEVGDLKKKTTRAPCLRRLNENFEKLTRKKNTLSTRGMTKVNVKCKPGFFAKC